MIYCGDCLEVMPTLPANSVDAIVTDPPYNIGYSYDGYSDTMRGDDYIQWQLEVLAECARLTRIGGSVLCLNYPETAARLFWAAPEVSTLVPYKIITWVYHQHTGGTPLRKATRSWAWWGVGGPPDYIGIDATKGQYRNPDDPRIQNMVERGMSPVDYDWWCYEQVKNVSVEKTSHPCQLPSVMVRRLCLLVTRPGETVFDPFCGSGTTGVACAHEGRNFIGIELSEDYCEIARRRIAHVSAQPTLQEAV